MIARIKDSWAIYEFQCSDGFKSLVYCYPQQKWEVKIEDGLDTVLLFRNSITIKIPKQEFEKNWRIIDEKNN